MSFANTAPKLSFRQNPLRLPRIKKKPEFTFTLDIEKQAAKPEQIKEKKQELNSIRVKTPQLPTKKYIYRIFFFGLVFILGFRLIQFWNSEEKMHTIYKLSCTTKDRVLSCDSATHKGTFIVEIPHNCAKSVYEVGGYPFSISKQDTIYKSSASNLNVKNIDGNCAIKAYVDSHVFDKTVPFTWVTTKKHTWFTIKVDNSIIVERADATLFSFVENGIWVAYTYDINVLNKKVQVIGDGDDVIHVYGV